MDDWGVNSIGDGAHRRDAGNPACESLARERRSPVRRWGDPEIAPPWKDADTIVCVTCVSQNRHAVNST
jgi:hypothetical protein